MNEPITGGCQCGQVRYEVKSLPFLQMVCHCHNCYVRVGPYNGTMVFPADSVEFTGDYHIFHSKGGSGRALDAYLCTKCGQHVGGYAGVLKAALVTASSLDDQSMFKPMAHVWVSEKPAWVTIDDDLPQCQGTIEWKKIGGRPEGWPLDKWPPGGTN